MLEEIKSNNREVLERLLQLYLHDISSFFPMDLDDQTGLYIYDDISKYFENENNKAFLIKNNKNIVGFMLIDFFEDKNVIQEMFILNNYKKNGYGRKSVIELFDKYKGNWEIKSLPCSKQAEGFWTSVVSHYTKDNFKIEYVGKYNRAVLNFNNEE